jgi:pimeloyl-ACP methyl ester carboxylesterase
MGFVEYGSTGGRTVVYFHGTPGAPDECSIFDCYAKAHNLHIVCFDRFSIDHTLDHASYYQAQADEVKRMVGNEPVDFVGFSMGAHVALMVSALLNGQVRQLHLVSAAAPLSAGNFIDSMAGGLVFKLVKRFPTLFLLLTYFQKAISAVIPRALFAMLFSNTAGKDRELSRSDVFRDYIIPVLRQCFLNGTQGYMRDMLLYVNWGGGFCDSASKVYLWHGTEDSWSPFEMARYLCDAIPGETNVEPLEGLSHYSCLFKAAPMICKRIDAAGGGV